MLRSRFLEGDSCLYLHEWKKLTSDVNILQTIAGNCIEFVSQPPNQWAYPPNSIQRDHKPLVDKEISSLLDKGVTVFTRLNAAAFIKFLAFPMRRLFKGGVYSRAAFISKS